jgi:FAD dependent oxidoreductase TIGR03364
MNETGHDALAGQRVVVVGGGIVGTMHSYLALLGGAQVVHLERDAVPHGATVRNFGLLWVSGRAAGRELDLALRARELWERIAADVPGVGFRANGSLTVATRPDEMHVLSKVMDRGDAPLRGFTLMDPKEVREKNPALEGDLLGGLYCELDAAVESRFALAALRSRMSLTGRYEYLANRDIIDIGDSHVVDHRGDQHRGDRVFLCLGANLGGFSREIFENEALRTVRLQMAETEPLGIEMSTSIANGDSLRYYPAFHEFSNLLEPQHEDALRFSIQLLCQQRLHGGLTIGDTHETNQPGDFECVDRPLDIIAAAARSLLGERMPRIERRWTGTYHQLSNPGVDEVYFRKQLDTNVIAVTGAGGRGMTLAPAIAEESFS